MQNDIDTILDWANTWLMRLNIEKCKVMHIGKKKIIRSKAMKAKKDLFKKNISGKRFGYKNIQRPNINGSSI